MSDAQEEPEVVDAEVVPLRRVPAVAEPAPERSRALLPTAPVAVQAAAVAATGFVAGAATLAVARRVSARRSAKVAPRRRTAGGLPVLASRSFLVDVHLLDR
ncbi:hypothetical protein [Conexibacter sp. SYSU D00693]|uniref:hypothetical protein n=1 Tax=Conexibacter sp. SYSU D00693 TaxID=2812560 RepID=UPI00196A8E60|nr:hypothetical protein [Conexibacter sp. SYSU D00693]